MKVTDKIRPFPTSREKSGKVGKGREKSGKVGKGRERSGKVGNFSGDKYIFFIK